jgi:hypothetical protein
MSPKGRLESGGIIGHSDLQKMNAERASAGVA